MHTPRVVLFITCCIIMLSAQLPNCVGAQLRASFADPASDRLGNIDLVGFEFLFDNESGAYTGTLWADPAAPFRVGMFPDPWFDFVTALWLGNTTRGVSFETGSILASNTGFYGSDTSFTITGTSAFLVGWQPGDLVTANPNEDNRNRPYPLGWTGVRDYPISLGIWTMDDIAFGQYAILTPVPEPGTLALGTVGGLLMFFGLVCRRRRA
jgi:hypothetical protein